MRGNLYTPARGVVIPPVIRTDQTLVLDPAVGEFCSTMDAQIAPSAKSATFMVTPEHKASSEEPCGEDLSSGRVRRTCHHVPIVQ